MKLRVSSFVATLGISQLVTGIVLYVSGEPADDRRVLGPVQEFGRKQYVGVPVIVVYLLVLAVIVWFVLEQTPVGRRLTPREPTPRPPASLGCTTDRLVWASLVVSATLAGLAGVLFSMKTGTFSSSIGPGYLFPAVAAVFFGTSQFSGRPNVWGTVVAYFALAFGIKGCSWSPGRARSGSGRSSRAPRCWSPWRWLPGRGSSASAARAGAAPPRRRRRG